MANSVYLEWYSERSGRVVIESTDYRLQISAPVWRFTAEELAERERRAAEADSSFAIEVHADGTVEHWDEFRCEQLLRESDMTGEKYRRLLEKYADHPDSERIIAHEMGWTKFYEALDEFEASSEDSGEAEENMEDEDELELEEEPPDPEREGVDWVRDDKEDGIVHPVAKHARDVLYALLDELRKGDRDLSECDEAIGNFTGHFMTLSVKLSSALSFIARGDPYVDPGMIIAWLKRALEIQNEALTAAEALTDHPDFGADRLAYYRAELFCIREGVLAVIARLRAGGEQP